MDGDEDDDEDDLKGRNSRGENVSRQVEVMRKRLQSQHEDELEMFNATKKQITRQVKLVTQVSR